MVKPELPVAPTVNAPRVTVPRTEPKPTPAHRAHVEGMRNAVRTQLAQSHRRRQELSDALVTLRRNLRGFRSQVRSRLREISLEIASRRTPPKAPSVPLPTAAAPVTVVTADTSVPAAPLPDPRSAARRASP
jgi:hypothetical protein